jgi:hypothetical protein
MDCKQTTAQTGTQRDARRYPEDELDYDRSSNFGRTLEREIGSRTDQSPDAIRSVTNGIALQRAVRRYIEKSLNEKLMKRSS